MRCAQWQRAVLVAGNDPDGYCGFATTALTTLFSSTNLTLAESIAVPDDYTDATLLAMLQKIQINGRSE